MNLLGSVQIAIVMVAGDLRIRRFTPMAEKVLNLIPTDVGRPISDIKPNIDCPDLEQLIAEAVDTVTIKEREVQDRHGNWFSLRIRPYKNVENRIDGAVLALFDIDSTKRLEAQMTASRGQAAARCLPRPARSPVQRCRPSAGRSWSSTRVARRGRRTRHSCRASGVTARKTEGNASTSWATGGGTFPTCMPC